MSQKRKPIRQRDLKKGRVERKKADYSKIPGVKQINSPDDANRYVAKHYADIITKRIDEGTMDIPMDWHSERKFIKGEDIISGEVPWEGEPPEGGFDPEKDYEVSEPVAVAHNIYKRLYKALCKSHAEFHRYLALLGLELREADDKEQKIG